MGWFLGRKALSGGFSAHMFKVRASGVVTPGSPPFLWEHWNWFDSTGSQVKELTHLKNNLVCWFAVMILAGMVSTWPDQFFHLAPLSPRSVCADTCRETRCQDGGGTWCLFCQKLVPNWGWNYGSHQQNISCVHENKWSKTLFFCQGNLLLTEVTYVIWNPNSSSVQKWRK